MKQDTPTEELASTPTWATALLGCARSQRRAAVDAPVGSRNGYGTPRRLAMQTGTITVRRPRVRGVEGRVESRILPVFERHTRAVRTLLPALSLHGPGPGRLRAGVAGAARGGGAPVGQFDRAAEGGLAAGARHLATTAARGPGAGLPLGGRRVREGRAGEGEGGGAGGDRGDAGRAQGGARRHPRLSRVDRVLGGGGGDLAVGLPQLRQAGRFSGPDRRDELGVGWRQGLGAKGWPQRQNAEQQDKDQNDPEHSKRDVSPHAAILRAGA